MESPLVQPEIRALDVSWTVSVGTQSVSVEPSGRFRLDNIAAPDAFGPDGPGSPADFVSDDAVRVIGVRQTEEGTLWAQSEPFRLVRDQTFFVGELTFDTVPPPCRWRLLWRPRRRSWSPARPAS